MATVTACEAKTRFGELLQRVARGEEVVITRHEKPVARIVPEGGRDIQQGKKAAAGLLAAVAAGAGLEELRLLPLACEDGPLLAAARKAGACVWR